MVVEKGYKQTEIGVIPEDWEIKLLEEIAEVIDPHPSHRAPAEVTTGIPFLGIGDFNENGEIIKESYRVVSYSIFDEHRQRYDLNNGLLGLGRVASIGKVIKFRNDIGKFTISPTMGVLKPTSATREYLFQILKSENTSQHFSKIMSGSTRSSVGMIVLRKIPIPIPKSLSEQKAIAQVLTDTDTLIHGLEKLIAKKRLIKQGAMQELLKPKEGWEVKKLGEIAIFYNGKAHEQYIDINGDYIVINSKFVSTEGLIFKKASNNLCPLFKGDIVMVMSDIPNGKALAKCYIVPENDKYALNQRICAIRTEILDNIYLAFILNRNKYYLSFDSGTGQTNLKKNNVLDCPISFPPSIEEQTRIATILSDMDKEIEALEKKLSKYQQLKQGLMQNLLTGKIRLAGLEHDQKQSVN